jgi:MFS superfamily sulfate permease-like transporter
MVNFISHPVITGFICSASITISGGQLKKLFGIHISTHKFFPEMWELLKNLKDTNMYDLLIGIISMLLIYLFKGVIRKKQTIFCQNFRIFVKKFNNTIEVKRHLKRGTHVQ